MAMMTNTIHHDDNENDNDDDDDHQLTPYNTNHQSSNLDEMP